MPIRRAHPDPRFLVWSAAVPNRSLCARAPAYPAVTDKGVPSPCQARVPQSGHPARQTPNFPAWVSLMGGSAPVGGEARAQRHTKHTLTFGMGKNGKSKGEKSAKNGGKLSQWAKIKIVCKVVRGKLQKAHTMGYLTVPGQQQEVRSQVPFQIPFLT